MNEHPTQNATREQVSPTYFSDIGAWPTSARHIGRTYAIGYLACLLLTGAAYYLATRHLFSFTTLAITIAVGAVLQFLIQMLCFLHLSKERSSRERVAVLCIALFIVSILVVGSLWIMFTLNGRMMPSQAQMEQYMNDQDGGI